MYRPGGFPEYSPEEQKIFDLLYDTLRQHFEQYRYVHIQTPAVEPVDILSRGGDIFDKQVYGLYGLAQGVEDVKDYALHFDLTIPFARYVLDHLNELNFPFKRYQAQAVWRGERQKRGRYKEFWQFDIDTIWRSSQEVGVRYDVESIVVMVKALQEVFTKLAITKNLEVKVSHIRLVRSLIAKWQLSEKSEQQLFKILDDWYKRTEQENTLLLDKVLSADQSAFLKKIVTSGDLSLLSDYEGYGEMTAIGDFLTAMGVQREFDIVIVRGHTYYTGMVAEIFIQEDRELGAIAGGGRYENLTDFIDKKHSFSGVGMSVSTRIMELLLQYALPDTSDESYLFLNFADSLSHILALFQQFIAEGKICELYPIEAKFAKQLEFAHKKGCRYAVIVGTQEVEKGVYQLKDLKTGEVKEIKLTTHH